jgi:hypothetical protein
VVVSAREYAKLSGRGGGVSLAGFLAKSPLGAVKLDIPRPRDSGRAVKL